MAVETAIQGDRFEAVAIADPLKGETALTVSFQGSQAGEYTVKACRTRANAASEGAVFVAPEAIGVVVVNHPDQREIGFNKASQ